MFQTKEKGEVGIRDIKMFNETLIGKWNGNLQQRKWGYGENY